MRFSRKHWSRSRTEQHHLQLGRQDRWPGEGERTRRRQVGQAQAGVRICFHVLFKQHSRWAISVQNLSQCLIFSSMCLKLVFIFMDCFRPLMLLTCLLKAKEWKCPKKKHSWRGSLMSSVSRNCRKTVSFSSCFKTFEPLLDLLIYFWKRCLCIILLTKKQSEGN